MSQRTTKVIGFSVPPEIYNEIINYAKTEQKTKSELFREMVAIYRSKKEEEEYQRLLKYGQLKALDLDIKSEEDVEKAIDEFRES